jgi:MFS family permease
MLRDVTGFRELSRNRDFTVLWTGETISQLGSSVSMFVFPLLGYALTGSATLAALGEAAFLLGMVTMLLPAGVLADRFDRRRLMLCSSAAGVLVYAVLAVATLGGVLTIGGLVAGALVTGLAAGLYGPAEVSAVRDIVPQEQLPTALSQNQARQHVASLLGGPIGGLLYTVSRALPFVVDVASYLVSCVALLFLRADLSAPARPGPTRVRADLREGFSHVWRHPLFRTLLCYGSLSNLVVNAVFYVAILRMVQAGIRPTSIGLVETCAGLGGILGALLAPRLIDRMRTGLLTAVVAWSWVPLVVPLAFTASPLVVGPCIGLGLLLNPAGNAAMSSYRVAITPARLQGRIGSTMQFCSMCTIPLAPVLGGVLLHELGASTATWALMVLVAGSALVPTLSRTLMAVPRPAEWPKASEEEAVAASVSQLMP